MKFTFRKAEFKSRCNDCQREDVEVFFSDTDINSDSAICENCLINAYSVVCPCPGSQQGSEVIIIATPDEE